MITKTAIINAALRLAEKKDIDRITVTDVVKECHITRQTFYYHFQDMFAVLEYGMDWEIREVVEKNKNCSSIEEVLYNYYDSFVVNNKLIISKLLVSRYSRQVLEMLVASLKSYFLQVVEKGRQPIEMRYKDVDFFLDYHVWAIAGLFFQWSENKDSQVEDGIRQITKILKGELHI